MQAIALLDFNISVNFYFVKLYLKINRKLNKKDKNGRMTLVIGCKEFGTFLTLSNLNMLIFNIGV